jgi:hypothetical protein
MSNSQDGVVEVIGCAAPGRGRSRAWLLASLGAALALLAACGGGATPSTEATGSSVDFTLTVLPERFTGMGIGGQPILLLVMASGAASDGPVEISATSQGAMVSVEPARLEPGVVGEITVIPAAVTQETELGIAISAARGDVEHVSSRSLKVFPGEGTEGATAAGFLARFAEWLEVNRPDLGITRATAWEEAAGPWVLIVTHYMYLSEEWELDLAWHAATIPPNDWVRINLRRRWVEVAPSIAFEISSAAAFDQPRDIPPDPAVWR